MFLKSLPMAHEPVFAHIHNADALLTSVADAQEFRVIRRPEGFFAIDYLYMQGESSFLSLLSPDAAVRAQARLRRECRGIKFDTNGDSLGRPYHKFFGMGQTQETQRSRIDLSQPHIIYDKLDGSMVHPIRLQDGIVLTTRKGVGDVAPPALAFAQRHADIDYMTFFDDMLHLGMTPIFEWCSRINTIVIDHPVDRLVLTSLRHHVDGTYVGDADMRSLARPYGVPVVDVLGSDVGDLDVFLAHIAGIVGAEGAVVRFLDGNMLKFKANAYLTMHGAKDAIALEKSVLDAILTDHDDDLMSALSDPGDQAALQAFATSVRGGIQALANEISRALADGKARTEGMEARAAQKAFAQLVQSGGLTSHPLAQPALFSAWKGNDPYLVAVQVFQKRATSQTDIDQLRPFWGGVHWMDLYRKSPRDTDAG